MSAVDFEQWAVPPLTLNLNGHTYVVQPPDVERAKKILAAAVRGEVNLGIVLGPVPDEIQAILDDIGPDEHPALGNVWQQMTADGLPTLTKDRMAYYAVFYWARGKEYADNLAAVLWTPREPGSAGGGGAAPKGSSRPKTGRRTAWANQTKKAGTRTIGQSRKR